MDKVEGIVLHVLGERLQQIEELQQELSTMVDTTRNTEYFYDNYTKKYRKLVNLTWEAKKILEALKERAPK